MAIHTSFHKTKFTPSWKCCALYTPWITTQIYYSPMIFNYKKKDIKKKSTKECFAVRPKGTKTESNKLDYSLVLTWFDERCLGRPSWSIIDRWLGTLYKQTDRSHIRQGRMHPTLLCSLCSSTIDLQKPEAIIAHTLSETKLILVTVGENDKAQTHVAVLKPCCYPNYYH